MAGPSATRACRSSSRQPPLTRTMPRPRSPPLAAPAARALPPQSLPRLHDALTRGSAAPPPPPRPPRGPWPARTAVPATRTAAACGPSRRPAAAAGLAGQAGVMPRSLRALSQTGITYQADSEPGPSRAPAGPASPGPTRTVGAAPAAAAILSDPAPPADLELRVIEPLYTSTVGP
jgi:hypothetical protein